LQYQGDSNSSYFAISPIFLEAIGRLGELQRLANGVPYRYMYREFFPQLRVAAYIKVLYDNY
jgi:hypothetical protein